MGPSRAPVFFFCVLAFALLCGPRAALGQIPDVQKEKCRTGLECCANCGTRCLEDTNKACIDDDLCKACFGNCASPCSPEDCFVGKVCCAECDAKCGTGKSLESCKKQCIKSGESGCVTTEQCFNSSTFIAGAMANLSCLNAQQQCMMNPISEFTSPTVDTIENPEDCCKLILGACQATAENAVTDCPFNPFNAPNVNCTEDEFRSTYATRASKNCAAWVCGTTQEFTLCQEHLKDDDKCKAV